MDSTTTRVQESTKIESDTFKASENGEFTVQVKVEAVLENAEDDWENDPDNARNWNSRKKWTAVFIVRTYPSYYLLSIHHNHRYLRTLFCRLFRVR